MTLDDSQRVKVLSPGQLVFKRFIRNKLAIVGTCILLFMFLFAFVGPVFYPYSQSEQFWKFDDLNLDYAIATDRTEYLNIWADENYDQKSIDRNIRNNMNSIISGMEEEGVDIKVVTDRNGVNYTVRKLGEKVYTLATEMIEIGVLNDKIAFCNFKKLQAPEYQGEFVEPYAGFVDSINGAINDKSFRFDGEDGYTYSIESAGIKNSYVVYIHGYSGNIDYTVEEELGDEFVSAAAQAAETEGLSFEFDSKKYSLTALEDGTFMVYEQIDANVLYVTTVYTYDLLEKGEEFSNQLKFLVYSNIYSGKNFDYDGSTYSIDPNNGAPVLKKDGADYARITTFAVRTPAGNDTFDVAFKDKVNQVITAMNNDGAITTAFDYGVPTRDYETGEYVYDENGNNIVENRTITVTRKNTDYSLQCIQTKKVLDRYASPSAEHILGTDGDSMDIFSRIMYGGRISLLVGFVVVIIETILGVIMGGIAGYFGGWVDNLIMRMVDIFYCIPSMPILIILGSLFETLGMDPYVRLMWLMAVLGFLGWAGIARLVRGQILSLREQEFMVAAESTGLRTGRRIFKHLVPNVMPQLIVSATMGLGGVILTESTLSFLGLGVKRPLATWGTMINAVTQSIESMTQYAYIWIPVGLLICLTVIAFNFVGDGLRDAFDPKMKR